jgi:peptide/nickel transport system substrate-binding protein
MYQVGPSTLATMQARNPNIVTWTPDPPYGYVDPCPRDLAINTALPPFDNPDVRWAINHAINRDQLIQIAYEGNTVPQAAQMPAYPPLQAFLDANADLFEEYPVLEYSLEKTEELMTGAGFTKDAEGFWVGADGERVTFDFVLPAGEADKEKMAPVLVEHLRAAGFDASYQAIEWGVFSDAESRGTAAGFLHDVCGSVRDPYKTLSWFHSRWAAPIGEPAPGGPGTRFSNEEFDALVDQMAVISADDPEFEPLAAEALEIWLQNLPMVSLVQTMMVTPYNETYWTNWPTAENNYVHPIAHWWVSGHVLLHNIEPAQ